MLVSASISAIVDVDSEAHFFWLPKVEFSVDCFVCRRLHRTTIVEPGDEGRCVSSRKSSEKGSRGGVFSFDEVAFIHPSPIRIVRFDSGHTRVTGRDQQTLRCVVSYWWAPFTDAKHGTAVNKPSVNQWVRLHYGLGCRACYSNGVAEALSTPGRRSLQSNTVWPTRTTCGTCDRQLVSVQDGPAITLLESDIALRH